MFVLISNFQSVKQSHLHQTRTYPLDLRSTSAVLSKLTA